MGGLLGLFSPSLTHAQTAEVVVQCERKLGDASQINDFLGAGGSLHTLKQPRSGAGYKRSIEKTAPMAKGFRNPPGKNLRLSTER